MKLLFILLFFFTLNSCQPKIEFINEIDVPKLVVWCILHPDSIPTAYVSQTSPLLSKSVNYKVSNAQVVLFRNDLPIDTFVQIENGTYKSSQKQKIIENNIYSITVFKDGFEKLVTPKDTMPLKPVVLSVIGNDSAIVTNGSIQASIILKTQLPSHLKNLGFGNFNLIGLPSGIGTKASFLSNGNSTCENNGSYSFLSYIFKDPSCIYFGENYELFTPNFYSTGFNKLKVKFTACAITNVSISFLKKLQDLTLQYTDFYSPVDVFWNPIYLPNYIKGGYGFFACYNTTDIEVQF